MRRRILFFERMRKVLFASALVLAACSKNHLYVQQEWVDEKFLASSHVGTPDPRSACPPKGQRLLIGWNFPRGIFDEQLTLLVAVRLWDQTEEVFSHPVTRKWGSSAFFFPNQDGEQDKKILTYRVQVLNGEGEVVEEWKHQFWTELIEVGSGAVAPRKSR